MQERQKVPALVLYDLDHTLLDASEAYTSSLRESLAQNFPRKDFTKVQLGNSEHSGRNALTNLSEIASEHINPRIFEDKRDRVMRTWVENYCKSIENGGKITAMPGAHKLLDVTENENCINLVVSSTPKTAIEAGLRKLGMQKRFAAVYGGENGKQKIENVREVLRQWLERKDPANIVIIGDSPVEARVAKELLIRHIGVATGLHSVEDLRKESKTSPVFENLSDTKAVMKEILGHERPQVRLAPNAIKVTRRKRT